MMKSLLYSLKSSTPKSTMSTAQAPEYPMVQSDALSVIELFQSQGCSSCPPANSNVLELAEDPNLLVLTYNVTYWDRLGWKDTFGNSTNDRRQWEYARAMSRKNVFTPQVIVNGEVDGVGNNARELQSLIVEGSAYRALNTVKVSPIMNGKAIAVVGAENEHGLVTIVRYDTKHYEVRISHGENGGRALPHSHVVKDVRQIGNWTGGSQQFELPRSKDDGLKVAVLVQVGLGGRVLGAARI